MADRTLHAQGLVNARDLGGLRRVDGGETPHGVFFRSESIDRVTEEGWDALWSAGIRTVVDLRQPGEREADTGSRPDWLTTVAIDHDHLDNAGFWRDYWENGLVATALYYLPHLAAMPERSAMVLDAVATAAPGGVLFHCMAGRDRTGIIAMLLLAAAGVEPEQIVDDYLETVRRAAIRAAAWDRPDDEPAVEALCVERGTTTEGAFRTALAGLNLEPVLAHDALSPAGREAVRTWRGTLTPVADPLAR
jgi:protein-tyrosine phosphatase